ncbi:hypothetical protein GCM10017044_26080 [Kordiimonas sediminis]|uniref:TonB C-terminal domain-containing protein n=1 Tax=Kordiimonas sediminis TaxID=1735581 RepID=A0A919EA87_9PROT|nr:energy transducer TonB [Kordiimonas sediminis]GHF29592.1 hypothetical protein GCM10017044_26080 [Kordiimonas sediminis]
MSYTAITKTLAAAAVVAGFSGIAHAGSDGGDLNHWAQKAGKHLTAEMKYPALAVRKNAEGSPLFQVTVSRNGDIEAIKPVRMASSPMINSTARKSLKKVDFPALPADYDGEKLTFSVQMNYAIAGSAQEERILRREGRVTSRQLANAGAPMVASITLMGEE